MKREERQALFRMFEIIHWQAMKTAEHHSDLDARNKATLAAMNDAYEVLAEVDLSTEIPPEHRTRPVTKTEVAKLVSPRRNAKASLRALNQAIFIGDFHCKKKNRSSYWFDLRDFCEEHQKKLS